MPFRFIGLFLLSCSLALQAFAETQVLPYRPIAIEYSAALDRLVMISANPNRIHVYDVATKTDVAVNLAKPPLSLTLSPDGASAAVGHDALISHVNLGSGAVARLYEVPVVAEQLTMSSSWIHVMPSYYGGSVSVNIANGNVQQNNVNYASGGKYNPSVKAIYGTRDGISPNDVQRYEASTGPITAQTDSPYHGDYSICGPVWFSPDGSRIYTGCGSILTASTDGSLDMLYKTSLEGVSPVRSLSESATLGKIALVQENRYREDPIDDKIVILNSAYLTHVGELQLPPFAAGGQSFPAHARWLSFRGDANELVVLTQADESSGALNDYGIERVSLAPSGACGTAFEVNSADAPAQGGIGEVEITAPANCVRQATASTSWVQLLSGSYGSGNGTLRYSLPPNPNAAARTAIVLIAGVRFTIYQAGKAESGSLSMLGTQVIDAEYNRSTDRIAFVTSAPPQLHIFDPATRSDRVVALVSEPLSVSLRPDGAYAAVGHDGWVSYVRVDTGVVERVIPVSTDVGDLVLAGNGYIYLFPRREWSDIYSYQIASDVVTPTGAVYQGRTARLTPDGKYMYATSSSWFSKWDLRNGVATAVQSTPRPDGCGNLWITEDGKRVFTACAKAYRSSEVPQEDLAYNGSLSETSNVGWADHSTERQMLAVIPTSFNDNSGPTPNESRIQLYSDAFLGFEGTIPLPPFELGNTRYYAKSRWVFWNRDGDKLYVIQDPVAPTGVELGSAIAVVSAGDTRQISVLGIINAASGRGGPFAPGEMVSIFGEGMGPAQDVVAGVDPETGKINTSLGGTEVYFGTTAAPILYASSTQVNAIIPYESYGRDLWVVYNGLSSASAPAPGAQTAPGIFTLDSSGSGQAVAFNHEDGSIADIAHPAKPGSYVSVYFTGGGVTNPVGETGAISGAAARPFRSTPIVTVGGVRATVSYAGVAPYFVEGLGQLNIRLADDTPQSDAAPIVMTYGSVSSQTGATIAVH